MKKEIFLKTVPLFRKLSSNDLKTLGSIMKMETIKKGHLVFSKGTMGDTFYVVEKGVIKIYSTSSVGKSKTFAYLGPKDFFGEMALLEKVERSASAVAVTPAVLLTVHQRDFKSLLGRHDELAFVLLRTLCERLRWADLEIESLTFNSVLGRLARILLQLCEKYGRPHPRGVAIELEISQQELADMVGTAREMVTRVLSRFARVGCIQLGEKHILITNAQKLQEWIL